MGRHCPQVGAAHLNIVAEHLVIADFEIADAGAFPLGGFQPGDIGAGVAGDAADCVQFGGKAGPDDAAVPHRPGRFGTDGVVNQPYQRRQRTQPGGQPPHRIGNAAVAIIVGISISIDISIGINISITISRADDAAQPFRRIQTAPQRQQIPGRRRVGLNAAQNAFQIRNCGQRRAGIGTAKGIIVEILHHIQTAFHPGPFQQRASQPAPQQPRPHRRAGIVQRRKQRQLPAVPAPGGKKLQIAPGLRIQRHIGVGAVRRRRQQRGMLALVGIAQIVNDGAGRPHRQGQRNCAVLLQPVGFQREDAVMPQQGAPRHLGLEGGGVHRG